MLTKAGQDHVRPSFRTRLLCTVRGFRLQLRELRTESGERTLVGKVGAFGCLDWVTSILACEAGVREWETCSWYQVFDDFAVDGL